MIVDFNAAEIAELIAFMTPAELRELDSYIDHDPNLWMPQSGPQTAAYWSDASLILYGGAAGGGKTDLALGKALTRHHRTIILRREYPQLSGIIDRAEELFTPYGKVIKKKWRCMFGGKERIVEFGAVQYEKNKNKYQGRPHDLIVFDEAANFPESIVSFISGWLRHENPKQATQLLLCSNPPTDATGDWINEWFAPWLNKDHPNPAAPGELRWFAKIKGKDVEVEGNQPFVLIDGVPCYEFVAANYLRTDIIKPTSRTFIPAKVTDNTYYADGDYISKLQALPEPLRSQMLNGDFSAGREPGAWQIIPAAWVRLAQERWKKRSKPSTPMTAVGCDIAMGGRDKTTIAPRFGTYFDVIVSIPGVETPDGQTSAARILAVATPGAAINIDATGIGKSTYDQMTLREIDDVHALISAESSSEMDRPRRLGFHNKRAEWWWKMREALDPEFGDDIALPPDPELLADLCAPNWKPCSKGIQVELKEEIKKRIGRSPDKGDAVVYALADTAGGGYAVSVNRGLR